MGGTVPAAADAAGAAVGVGGAECEVCVRGFWGAWMGWVVVLRWEEEGYDVYDGALECIYCIL